LREVLYGAIILAVAATRTASLGSGGCCLKMIERRWRRCSPSTTAP